MKPVCRYPGVPNPATLGSGLSVHQDKLDGGVTKGKALALAMSMGSDGAPELGAAASDKHVLVGLRGAEMA